MDSIFLGAQVHAWSQANPGHSPITIVLHPGDIAPEGALGSVFAAFEQGVDKAGCATSTPSHLTLTKSFKCDTELAVAAVHYPGKFRHNCVLQTRSVGQAHLRGVSLVLQPEL